MVLLFCLFLCVGLLLTGTVLAHIIKENTDRLIECQLAAEGSDLLVTQFDNIAQLYLKNSPVTCEHCYLHESPASTFSLLYLNSGQMYDIDMPPFGADGGHGFAEISVGNGTSDSGDDALNHTSHSSCQFVDQQQTDITLKRNGGQISLKTLKSNFCENCIQKIFHAVGASGVSEVVMIDPAGTEVYQIKETTYEMERREVTVSRARGSYTIRVAAKKTATA